MIELGLADVVDAMDALVVSPVVPTLRGPPLADAQLALGRKPKRARGGVWSSAPAFEAIEGMAADLMLVVRPGPPVECDAGSCRCTGWGGGAGSRAATYRSGQSWQWRGARARANRRLQWGHSTRPSLPLPRRSFLVTSPPHDDDRGAGCAGAVFFVS